MADTDEKESEIQIGHPTDVKHVAHIGWDSQGQSQVPSETNPSWVILYFPKKINCSLHIQTCGISI